MRRSVAVMLLAVAVAASGCGYRLQGAAGSRFTDASVRMDVSSFGNASTVPDPGSYLATRLREELRRGGYRGEFDRLGADFLVEGKVMETREGVVSHCPDRLTCYFKLFLCRYYQHFYCGPVRLDF